MFEEETNVTVELFDRVRAQQQEQADADAARLALAEQTRRDVDESRIMLASLTKPAVMVLYHMVAGDKVDTQGIPITEERERAALQILDRAGIPKLRATAIHAHLAQAPLDAAEPVRLGAKKDDPSAGQEEDEDPASLDAQIDSFMAGMMAAKDLAGDRAREQPEDPFA